MERDKIDEKYKWDLEVIYSNINEFAEEYNKVRKDIDALATYENKYMSSAENFYNAIVLSNNINRKLEKLYSYSSLSFDLNTKDNKMQEIKGKVLNLYDYYNKKSYFMIPSMLKYEYSDIVKFYDKVKQLKDFDISIKRIFRYKDHTLSDSEEKLLSSMGKTIGNNYETYELFKDAELSFDDVEDEAGNLVELSNSSYSKYIESKDRKVRESAFKGLYDKYKQFTNTFASLFFNDIKENVEIAKIKKYNSAREMSMYADEVTPEICDTLIEEVHRGLPILYRYYDLKKKILGLSDLHLYDIYVPLISESNEKYPYDKAVDIVLDALSVFGSDYVNILRKGINNRWIDVYPTNAKRSGGYSGGSYDTYPYILLNYQDKYNDMSTLAHEGGHSMHSYYARSNNPYQYGDYTIFVAEVASTVNELILANYMLKNSKDDKEKLSILDRLMNLYKATIFRQTMFAEFERDVYDMAEKDITLTSDILCDKYYELNKLYFGDNVVVDDEIRYEWERIPHFYYSFYVYKYATGLSAATNIVTNILDGKDKAVEDYINFLKCGSTKSPIDSLKVAGVDLNDKETVKSAINYFDNIVKEFEELYNKVESNN